MSNKSWKLKISAQRSILKDSAEETKSEEEPVNFKEDVFMALEILHDTESEQTFLYTKRMGGSNRFFNDLWTSIKDQVLLYE